MLGVCDHNSIAAAVLRVLVILVAPNQSEHIYRSLYSTSLAFIEQITWKEANWCEGKCLARKASYKEVCI